MDHNTPTPTSTWLNTTSYTYTGTVPTTLAYGNYTLLIGLYDPSDFTINGRTRLLLGPGVIDNGDKRYNVGSISVVAPQPPVAPSNIVFSDVTSSSLKISWQDNSANETGFKILASTDNSTFTQVGSVAANITQFNHTALQSNTDYFYRVIASNLTGDSAPAQAQVKTDKLCSYLVGDYNYDGTVDQADHATWSSQYGAKGPGHSADGNQDESVDAADYTVWRDNKGQTCLVVPNEVSDVEATFANNSVSLEWQYVGKNEAGFKVSRSTNGTNYTEITTLQRGTMTYVDTNIVAGQTYYYSVSAYNVTGPGVAGTTILVIPSNCQITQSACPFSPDKVGTFYDNHDGSAANEGRCMRRGAEYSEWCNNPRGTATTSEFKRANGTSAVYTITSTGCFVVQFTCVNFPDFVGVILDDHQNSGTNETRCLARASEYSLWCNNPSGTETRAKFVRPDGSIGTRSYVRP
jgi:hypothetical protein